MTSYVERHISFGVDEFEGLWKLQFLHPFFFADAKRVITVYVIPPNSDFEGSEYDGHEVVDAGANLVEVMTQLLPMIQKYPYRWELEGRKLDSFGYDLVSNMSKSSEFVGSIDFTDIAFAEIKRYYDFAEATPLPEVVIEDEQIQRNGALVKLGITLEKAQWTNQVSFDFFTGYPIEVVSVMYQEDTMKYSAVYEIPLSKVELSASSISILFPSVFAKKFTVILAQSTYTVTNQKVSGLSLTDEDINPAMLALNMGEYLNETFDQVWADETIVYESSKMQKKALASTATTAATQTEWRPQYEAAKNKSSQDMLTYEQKLKEYQEAESKYKEDMEEYVRYQKQLADWYGKWG